MTARLDLRVLYRSPRTLSDADPLVMAARTIPGVWYHRTRELFVPWGAVPAVQRLYRAAGEPGPDRPEFAPPTDDHVQERLRESETRSPDAWTTDLLPFQRAAVRAALTREGGLLWQAGGAGKTRQGLIWALCSPGPIIIVTKAAVRRTYVAEITRFANLDPLVLLPPSLQRKRDRDLDTYMDDQRREGRRPVIVLGWESLPDFEAELRDVKATSIIFDEIHKARAVQRYRYTREVDDNDRETWTKTDRSPVGAAAQRLAKSIPRRLGTTATPVFNALGDLWGQLTLIEPSAWGQTATAYLKRYLGASMGEFGLVVGTPTNQRELLERLQAVTHKTPYSESHGQLPKRQRIFTFVPKEQQVKEYPGLTAELRALGKRVLRGDRHAAAAFFETQATIASSRKRGVLKERIEHWSRVGKGKVLVMTGRVRDAEHTVGVVAKLGLPGFLAHGGVDVDEVTGAYMAHPGPCCLVGTYQAIGTGLNLHDSDALLFSMIPWEPGVIEQAEARPQRLGMTRPCCVEFLIAEGTRDEDVVAIVLNKLPAVETINEGSALDGIRRGLRREAERESIISALIQRLQAKHEEDE